MKPKQQPSLNRTIRHSPYSKSTLKQKFVTVYNKSFISKPRHYLHKPHTKSEININYFPKHLKLTSTNWCLYDLNTDFTIGYREQIQRQVASLTKIMTAIVAIELISTYSLDKNMLVRISRSSVSQIGTSANLKEGKLIKLYDLLYGTMLPSGNDAAYLLGQVLGLLLFYEVVKPNDKSYSQIQCIDVSYYDNTWPFINKFIKHMNKKAKQLQLKKTFFANLHGLSNVLNTSTAKDIIQLSKYAFANEQFRKIANTQQYISEIYTEYQLNKAQTKMWRNTNKLLGRGWQGIKTGQTNSAGACLSSFRQGVFITLLNCQGAQARFQQTILLYQWYQDRSQWINKQIV